MIEAPGADAFDGGRHRRAAGSAATRPGALDFLTGAALCLPRAAWERVGPFDERLFLYYEDVEWWLRARAAGVRAARRAEARRRGTPPAARRAAGEGETWAYYSTRNRLWLLQRHARPRRRRGARPRTPSARALPARCASRSAARKLEGVRDWAARPHGPGALPAVRVAFDGVVFTQSRAGSARVARGLLDALPAVAPDVEIVQRRRGALRRARQRAPEARRAPPGPRAGTATGSAAPRGGAGRTCCTARRSAAPLRRAGPAGGRDGARPRGAARAGLVPGLEPQLRPPADAARDPARRPGRVRVARDRARRRPVCSASPSRGCGSCRTASTRCFSEPPARAPVDGPYILFVGHARAAQEPPAALAARRAAASREGRPERLVLAGADGWGGVELPAARAHRAARPRRRRDAARPLRARRGCVAYPSLWEGFGLVAGEALAAGCPVVCSDLPALREVAGADAVVLRPALGRLDRRRAARARSTGRGPSPRRALTWEAAARALVDVWRELAREHAAARAASTPTPSAARGRATRRTPSTCCASCPDVGAGPARSPASLRDPAAMPDDVPPSVRRLALPVASPYRRIPFALAAPRPQREARRCCTSSTSSLRGCRCPSRRDGARPQLHAAPRALRAARPHAARPARAGLGAARPARDRRVRVHARRSARSLRARARARRRDPERRRRALPSRSRGRGRGARDARPRAAVRAVRRRAAAAQERAHAGRGVRPAARAPTMSSWCSPAAIAAVSPRCATRVARARPRRARATARPRLARRRCPGSTAPPSCSRSRRCTRGSGCPALEAMACGTPVCASSTTGLGEAVGDAGLTFDPTLARGDRRVHACGCSRTTAAAGAAARRRPRARGAASPGGGAPRRRRAVYREAIGMTTPDVVACVVSHDQRDPARAVPRRRCARRRPGRRARERARRQRGAGGLARRARGRDRRAARASRGTRTRSSRRRARATSWC